MYKMFVLVILSVSSLLNAQENQTTIYFQPNTTQIFSELYQAYGLLNPPERTFFDEALYLDQSIPPAKQPLQPSNQTIFDHADTVLSEFHTKMNDLELYIDPSKPKPFFYTAAGSKHLIVALVYSIVTSEPQKKFVFVEQAPFYSGHSDAVTGLFNYPNARFVSFHAASEIKVEDDEILVEFVTSPNNPDGTFRKPVTQAEIIIADFVFASSAFGGDETGYLKENLAWIREARAKGKHIFSFNSASKQFGKTGSRCGYIWYPLHDPFAHSIFNKFFGFISSSTVASGTSGLAEFLNLIKAFLDLPDNGKALRQDAKKSLMKRHELVEKELLKRYPGSKVISIPGSPTFFAKIQDARIPQKDAWEVMRDDFNVVVNNAKTMGETSEFIRMNLSGYSQGIAEFLNRLAGETKYQVTNLLLVSKNVCSEKIVIDAVYFVKPGDCSIKADASKNPIDIYLPNFFGYPTIDLHITKTDKSANPVVIKTSQDKIYLKSSDDTLHMQWREAFYSNGSWQKKVD